MRNKLAVNVEWGFSLGFAMNGHLNSIIWWRMYVGHSKSITYNEVAFDPKWELTNQLA